MNRAFKLIAACFAAVLFAGVGTAGAATKTTNISDFTGAASSHAVKISIGNIELTVGGGQSNAAYQLVGNTLKNVRADAKSTGLIIPGIMNSSVACVPPKLTDSLVGLSTPKSLPLLSATLAQANCSVSVKQLPTAGHAAGLVDAALSLTPDLVDTSAVDSLLSTVQGQLGVLPAEVRDRASNVIALIQQKLTSSPLLDIQVAPNSGIVTSTKQGLTSAAPGTAVTLNLLGGVVSIQIAVADATAKIVNGNPVATAAAGFVRVKALDITTGKSLIDQTISIPQDISLLQGTPLALNVVTTRGTTSTQCPGSLAGFNACATGVADAVSLKMLSAPLPTIGVSLVQAQALAAAKFGTRTTSTSSPSLPKTGAAAGATVLAGLVLAGGALVVRRYMLR